MSYLYKGNYYTFLFNTKICITICITVCITNHQYRTYQFKSTIRIENYTGRSIPKTRIEK